jgi:LacI family transcriptional regulator
MHGPISLSVSAGHFDQSLPNLRHERKIGVIARLSVPGVVQAVKKHRVPLIALEPVTKELAKLKESLRLAEIRSDSEEIAEMGAEFLWNDGFRNFAYCGFPNRLWSNARRDAFLQCIAKRGGYCTAYPTSNEEYAWNRERTKKKKWLRSLSKPVGLLACDDDRALQILKLCEEEGIRVPQEVSVLGVGNDDILCDLANPPLSSISIDLQTAGYNAVQALVDLIEGKTERPDDIAMPPLWVIPRMSTDFLAVSDPLVVKALQFIRQNYLLPINVADVVRYTGISRRSLELKFSAVPRRTIADEIQHRRLERAKRLLMVGDEPITNIALLSGFFNFRSMLHAFHAIEGCTPGEYQEKHAISSTPNDDEEHDS